MHCMCNYMAMDTGKCLNEVIKVKTPAGVSNKLKQSI